jgi:hypothetical protein
MAKKPGASWSGPNKPAAEGFAPPLSPNPNSITALLLGRIYSMTKKDIHVVPHEDGWATLTEGASRAGRVALQINLDKMGSVMNFVFSSHTQAKERVYGDTKRDLG